MLLLYLQCGWYVFLMRWDYWSLLVFGVIMKMYLLCSQWVLLVVNGVFCHWECQIGIQCYVVMGGVVVVDIFRHYHIG